MKLKTIIKIKGIPITKKKPKKSKYSILIITNPITGDIGKEIKIKSFNFGNSKLRLNLKSLFFIKKNKNVILNIINAKPTSL